MNLKGYKGSYTIEAAIYIPLIICMLFQSIGIAIEFWQVSRTRQVFYELQSLNIVEEFYGYQILKDIEKEILDD